jgi:multisubunit Na+/H+ antiporter MnhG subunit
VELDDPDQTAEAVRRRRLTEGLRRVQVGRGRRSVDRWLVMASGALVAMGVLLILFGWHGASRTPNVYEQVPYLISGGQLGQTLALLGALLYFGRWLAALLQEQRAQGAAIVAAITRLEASLTPAPSAPVAAEPTLVATARGTLAHRPDCSVVAGRAGLRAVPSGSAMAHCKVCLPE